MEVDRASSTCSSRTMTPNTGDDDVSHGSEVVNEVVANCWKEVDVQDANYRNRKPIPPQPLGIMGWRTVRIFVSSTFSDFFCEREVLVKKVFPELREWGRERKVRIIDCDLRWGVPHDSTSSETIATCMEELDACHETNEAEPFFINLLGDRYGWIPKAEENSSEVIEKYDWIDKTSITFMEILHGAYRRRNPNAIFFMRDGSFLSSVPSKHIKKFKETDPLGIQHLKVLKSKIRTRFDQQVFEYTTHVMGLSSATGNEKVQLACPDSFSEKCLHFFKAAIDRKYPMQQTVDILSAEERETELQRMFLVEKAELVFGRELETEKLLSYMTNPASCKLDKVGRPDEIVLTSTENDGNVQNTEGNLLCIVQAKSGQGKTSLLAHIVLVALQRGLNLFYHFCGSTVRSRQVGTLMERLLEKLEIFDDKTDRKPVQASLKEQQLRLEEALLKFKESGETIVVIIDAVNELDASSGMNHLSWLPSSLPSNVRMIVSCNEHPPTLARVEELHCYWLTVGELSDDNLQAIAVSYFGKYNKRLDREQLQALTENKHVNSPLWMTLICEELRIFGDYRSLTQKILTLPPNLDGLFGDIFRRLLAEDSTSCIKKALCLISTSSYGLPSQEVLKLLGDVQAKEEVAPLIWAQARRHLKPYLRISGFPNEFLTFSHELIWKAVKDHVLVQNEMHKWQLHQADFYQYWCDNADIRSSVLPNLLLKTQLKDRLVEFMQDDEHSWLISPFVRSDILRWCRCTHPIMSTSSSSAVVICTFCSYKRNCMNPGNQNPCKDCCVVCGALCVFQKTSARMCSFHCKSTPNTSHCFVCERTVHTSVRTHGYVPGKLCQQCGFGHSGNTCAHLGVF